MKKIAISQSNYIPWKGYFDAINSVDEFVLYDDMQYTKRDWRNRNKIKTKDGIKWLTVPVEVAGKYFQKINETIVSNDSWRQDHWASITHSYNKASFFKMYKDVFEEIYLNTTEKNLSKINYAFIKAICDILKISTTLLWSSQFELKDDRNERLIHICKERNGTDYFSGPAAKFYMDESLFNTQNICVHYFDYAAYPEYNQMFGDFSHEVSILDLIFNEGPNATNYLKSFDAVSEKIL